MAIATINAVEQALCPHTATLREAVARINECPYLFQIVVDDSRRLLGVLTDGDVRRALLRGVGLESSVTAAMNSSPKLGRIGRTDDNIKTAVQLDERTGFLPVVDDEGRVHEILLVDRRQDRPATALIMAGGKGSRLGERTRNTPKPLLPIGDRPMLDRILESLEASGIERIFVAVHYLADQIETFVADRQNRAVIELLKEPRPLGTAGALGMLPVNVTGDILVLNGDVMTKVDFQALFTFHRQHGGSATLAASQQMFQVPFGVLRTDPDGSFRGIEEKPTLNYFVNSGIYVLPPAVYRLVGGNEPCDMPDLLNRTHALGLPVKIFPVHEYWQDVGRPADLESANRRHRAPGPEVRS